LPAKLGVIKMSIT